MINRNMRCIEISRRTDCRCVCGLIETWDVLKFFVRNISRRKNSRLIETWDVLKSEKTLWEKRLPKRLIETWDVLKFIFCV